MSEKYSHLQFLISRLDHYYDTINNKANFYLGLNTFLITGMLTTYYTISQKSQFTLLEEIMFICSIVFGLISIVYIFKSINPFLKSGNIESEYKTLIFFGSICKFEKNVFVSEIKNQSDEILLNDMCNQVHQLSIGLNKKFESIQVAGKWIFAQFILICPITIIIISKLKQ